MSAAQEAAMTVEHLSGDECRRLLATGEVGRLGVVVGGYPEIFPVNYRVARGRVVVRTDPGVKLDHAHFERVGFQVDELDWGSHTGWSVLVKGVVHEVAEGGDEMEELRDAVAALDPWPRGERAHLLVVTPMSITGRRLGQAAPSDTTSTREIQSSEQT